MSSLDVQYGTMLEKILDSEYVVHLPALLDRTKPEAEKIKKNRSRAFSAFALHNLCGVSKTNAAKAVIDDFDDFGVDAVYYHALTETVFLVQGKLKASEQFHQDEALAFCQGIKKLIRQDLIGFNAHAQERRIEIEDAFEKCNKIQIVIAHTGSGVSAHAVSAIQDLLDDSSHGEERFVNTIINYDASMVQQDIQEIHAFPSIRANLHLLNCTSLEQPRKTYTGIIPLHDLASLHEIHKEALYEKNIRTFLGTDTDVNTSIQKTLAESPAEFYYLNNGVTALCSEIEPKNTINQRKKLVIDGLSVINGAQTIASSAKFIRENPTSDISSANVSITLIQASPIDTFGKSVTRARNHQNPVSLANFAALDDGQERLRRDVAHLGIHYIYKAGTADSSYGNQYIRIEEVAQALAIMQNDPRFVVWLKKEPRQFLDTSGQTYQKLFTPDLTAYQIVNAVRLNRYFQHRMAVEASSAHSQERLIYKHGNFAVAWVMAKRLRLEISKPDLIDVNRMRSVLSTPFDNLRQLLFNETEPLLVYRGPLGFFRNQSDTISLLRKLMIENYGLQGDTVITYKRQKSGEPYPVDLFEYLADKAPQIRIV